MGPLSTFLPRFPKVPAGIGFAQGLAVLAEPQKALRLRNALVATDAGPASIFIPVFSRTPETALGRSLPVSVSDKSCPVVTLTGPPLVIWRSGAISQSLANHFAAPWSGNFVV